MMLHPLADPDLRELVRDDPQLPATDSLQPCPDSFLVRSNLPGLCFEIENPDTDVPVLSFDLKAG
jgi:hypothetical protein